MTTVLNNRTFLSLFAIGALQSVTRWLELLALGVYVFDLTNSAFLVALVTLVKFAPLALFGIPCGALPNILPPRSLYVLALVLMIAVNVVGIILAAAGSLSVVQVLLLSFVGGLFWVFDFPVRRALIGDAVASSQLGQAMAIDTIANNGTRMLGPVAGGALLQFFGLAGAFFLAVVLYVICLLLTLSLRIGRETVKSGQAENLWANVLGGIRLVREKPLLLGILTVTVAYNLFAFPMLALVPVIGRDILELSPGGVGLLASMEGTGALLGSLLVLRFGRHPHYRKYYIGGLAICFGFSFLYALLEDPILIGAILIMVGIGSAAFAAMQTTLLILNSARQYRSRLFGLLSLSIGSGLIGFAVVGILAHLLGAQTAIVISATCGVLSLLWICRKWPELLDIQQ